MYHQSGPKNYLVQPELRSLSSCAKNLIHPPRVSGMQRTTASQLVEAGYRGRGCQVGLLHVAQLAWLF